MFEHFRLLFVCAFQINALALYIVPLTLRFKKEPVLLATVLIALSAIFKSYPCVGDVGFYLALLPLWKHLFMCMYFCINIYNIFSFEDIFVKLLTFFSYAAEVYSWVCFYHYFSTRSNSVALMDLFWFSKCQFFLWCNSIICYCTNFSYNRFIVCIYKTRIHT